MGRRGWADGLGVKANRYHHASKAVELVAVVDCIQTEQAVETRAVLDVRVYLPWLYLVGLATLRGAAIGKTGVGDLDTVS